MCGRFTLITPYPILSDFFGISPIPTLEPRYNIAPGQPVSMIRSVAGGDGAREMVSCKWGLIPSWASDPRIAYKAINARSETAADKPMFREAYRSRRCLIPADGFYEWQQEGRSRQPFHIRLVDEPLFAFAGLWETWTNPEGEVVPTCTILTTRANRRIEHLHERMPVILSPEDHTRWLAPTPSRAEDAKLFESYPAEKLTLSEANPYVNNARNEGPVCLEAVVQRTLFD